MTNSSILYPEMCVGRVIEISGTNVIIELFETCNSLTYLWNGEIYKGVTVGQFIGICREPYTLIAKVEREYLKDVSENNSEIFSKGKIVRHIAVKLQGFFTNINHNSYKEGIIAYPQIYNQAILLREDQIHSILVSSEPSKDQEFFIPLGSTINERINIRINPFSLFNSHLGIFGNTGSGKSNTLAKIYTELFLLHQTSSNRINLKKSHFIIIDFNGEYTGEEVFTKNKQVIFVGDQEAKFSKIKITQKTFWDIETLSIIFSATEKTQKPFLKNAINYFIDKNKESPEISSSSLINGIGSAFYNVFNSNNSKDTNDLLHRVYDLIFSNFEDINKLPWSKVEWHTKSNTYRYRLKSEFKYLNITPKEEIIEKRNELESILDTYAEHIENLSLSKKIEIALICELIFDLCFNKTRLEFITPLIERVRSQGELIDNCIELISTNTASYPLCSIISLRNCSTSLKKVIPLLIARDSYQFLKKKNRKNIQDTIHLIIDEAHNILSEQSSREDINWKDYRLEVFEEIIKEGRKFGYTLTLASQRPYDISPTIISQLHNYFIHRLVNDKDLLMVDNAISTLDGISKSRIPNLSPGQCILTGSSFSMPLTVQIEKLPDNQSPNSESADLKKLWLI